jgi:plastocyanin
MSSPGTGPGTTTSRDGPSDAEVRLTAAYVAAVFSVIAVLLSSVALGFSLRPRRASSPPAGVPRAPANSTSSTSCPASAHLAAGANDHGAAPATGTEVSVQAGDFFFTPTCVIDVAAGATVTLTVHNGGQALHNVTFADQGVDTDVAPGQTVKVTVKIGGAGSYPYYCKYHRTSGMVGALVAGGA